MRPRGAFLVASVLLLSLLEPRSGGTEPQAGSEPYVLRSNAIASFAIAPNRLTERPIVTDASAPFATDTQPLLLPEMNRSRSSRATVAFEASFCVLQLLDTLSTLEAIEAGATEANPVLQPLSRNRAALFGAKAATSAGLVLLMEHWRKHNPRAALVTTIVLNGALAAIVAHNYSLARR